MSVFFYLFLLYLVYRALNSTNPAVQFVVIVTGLWLAVKLLTWLWWEEPLFFVFFFAFLLVGIVLHNLGNALRS